jgi:hypothetical protein
MNETLIAPGVYSNEVDQSNIPQAAEFVGLAVVGPTEKGAAFIPTDISSFSQYTAIFGQGAETTYIPQTVASYLQSGEGVKVTRILGNGGWSFNATKKLAAIVSGSTILTVFHPSENSTPVVANFNSSSISGSLGSFNLVLNGTGINKTISGSLTPSNDRYITKMLGIDQTFQTGSGYPYLNFGNFAASQSVNASASLALTDANCSFTSSFAEGYSAASTPWVTSAGGVRLFKFVHNSHGTKTNRDVKIGISSIAVSADPNAYAKFNIIVRAWDDTERTPVILESYLNVTLDPNASNYIGRVIGDKYQEYDSNLGKVVEMGDFPSLSNYIRVQIASSVANDAIIPSTAPAGHEAIFETIAGFTGYRLPAATYTYSNTGSAAYSGFNYYDTDNINYLAHVPQEAVAGNNTIFTLPVNDNKFILPLQGGSDGMSFSVIKKSGVNMSTDGTNWFGFDLSTSTSGGSMAFKKALDILSNESAYSFNLLVLPGVTEQYHGAVTSYATTVVESRKDAVIITDLTGISANVKEAVSIAAGLDSTYAATYYPWVKVKSVTTGKDVYMPPSVAVPAAFAYNDKVAASWYAVAGTARGGLGKVTDVKNSLSRLEIAKLYAAGINSIVKKNNVGVVIWGQKTTQNVDTALTGLNVRRGLIEIKNYVINVAEGLLWENNTTTTRNSFLTQVNPYLENVQSRQGLYAFRVIMDETNNSNADIDRGILRGRVRIQPTIAIEYVDLTFNITPTGVTFD